MAETQREELGREQELAREQEMARVMEDVLAREGVLVREQELARETVLDREQDQFLRLSRALGETVDSVWSLAASERWVEILL